VLALALACGAAALGVVACASQTEYPRELYVKRHYIEAEDLFDHLEADLSQLSVPERAEYGVYRGMTLLSLGDFPRAQLWLSYATTLQREHPQVLADAETALLARGWARIDAEQARRARQATTAAPAAQATLPTAEAPMNP
jgi:hypothetical protein